MRRQAVVAWLVLGAALSLYTLTAGGSLTSTDAVVAFDLTRSLVEERSLALSGNLLGLDANRGRDGRFYSQFGLGQSLYNIPFYLAGKSALRLLGRPVGKPDSLLKAAVALGSAVAAAVTVCLLWLLTTQITGNPRAGLVGALSAAVASPLWPYSKFGFSAALVAAILTASALCLYLSASRAGTREAAAAGVLVAFGWLTRHEMSLVILPFALFLLLEGWRRGRTGAIVWRPIIVFVLCAAVGGALWMWYNFVRFGSPTEVGYEPTFGPIGYAGFLVAPGGSVLLFCPMLIAWGAGLWRARASTPLLALLVGPVVVFYLFYGALLDWPGGRSYGPRYLVPSVVLLSSGAGLAWALGQKRTRVALVLVIFACATLQLPGVLVDYSRVSLEWARGATRSQIEARNWRMSSSPLVLNAHASLRRVPENIQYVTGRAAPPSPSHGASDREFAQQFAFSLDFWWLYLRYLGVVRASTALLLAGSLLLSTVVFSVAAWRRASACA